MDSRLRGNDEVKRLFIMFNLSKKLGIDLGTANSLVWLPCHYSYLAHGLQPISPDASSAGLRQILVHGGLGV
jgi:hypothetical protein